MADGVYIIDFKKRVQFERNLCIIRYQGCNLALRKLNWPVSDQQLALESRKISVRPLFKAEHG